MNATKTSASDTPVRPTSLSTGTVAKPHELRNGIQQTRPARRGQQLNGFPSLGDDPDAPYNTLEELGERLGDELVDGWWCTGIHVDVAYDQFLVYVSAWSN